MDAVCYSQRVRELGHALAFHLRNRYLKDADNQRLLDGVGWQSDLGHVLRLLEQEGIEPTNNRAERDLRPAVIARKVSHCSKNDIGARAFEAFTSVIQTLRKTHASGAFAQLVKLMDSPPATASPLS
jgi:hypothetical protein